jgi:hypothetical protein
VILGIAPLTALSDISHPAALGPQHSYGVQSFFLISSSTAWRCLNDQLSVKKSPFRLVIHPQGLDILSASTPSCKSARASAVYARSQHMFWLSPHPRVPHLFQTHVSCTDEGLWNVALGSMELGGILGCGSGVFNSSPPALD